MSRSVDRMLAHFANQFGQPPASNTRAFFDTFRHQLGGVSESILARATELFDRENEYPSWPTPGRILRYVDRATEELATHNRALGLAAQPRLEPPRRTAQERENVNALAMRFIEAARARERDQELLRLELPRVDHEAFEARRIALIESGQILNTPTFARGYVMDRSAYADGIKRWIA